MTHWSAERLAQAAIQRGIVAVISERTVPLNTPMSVLLVMLVAVLCTIPLEGLGKPRKYGILKLMASRKALSEEATHRIRFVFTPKYCVLG